LYSRPWAERRTDDLPVGFAVIVRAWLLILLDGDARTRPRSHASIYVYFGGVHPHLQRWAATRGHLREVTAADVTTALDPLRGERRSNAIVALRSLFRFAKKRGLIFADPTARLVVPRPDRRGLLPLTDAEIHGIEQNAVTPAQRLIVALAAVHAARAVAIRHLALDDLDLPNRRITLAGHTQHLGEMTRHLLQAWLEHRRTRCSHTPNRHVLISERTALGSGPISPRYLSEHLLCRGIYLQPHPRRPHAPRGPDLRPRPPAPGPRLQPVAHDRQQIRRHLPKPPRRPAHALIGSGHDGPIRRPGRRGRGGARGRLGLLLAGRPCQ